jgi:hypothetical protein
MEKQMHVGRRGHERRRKRCVFEFGVKDMEEVS